MVLSTFPAFPAGSASVMILIIPCASWIPPYIHSRRFLSSSLLKCQELEVRPLMELQMLWLFSGRLTLACNVSAMSSGGFGTTHYQNTTNEHRKHKR